jgi:hypothetical protein
VPEPGGAWRAEFPRKARADMIRAATIRDGDSAIALTRRKYTGRRCPRPNSSVASDFRRLAVEGLA